MADRADKSWRIGICGSASAGKTSLATALAEKLGSSCLPEEMREYLERTRVTLSEEPVEDVARILSDLWQSRKQKEMHATAFVADNCTLDFAAYALYYGCLNKENAGVLLSETAAHTAQYDAIFVLPWDVLPYVEDGVRPSNPYLQLRYQLILEGLLRRYSDPSKVYFVPDKLRALDERCNWVLSVLERLNARAEQNERINASALRGESPGNCSAGGFVYLVGAGPGDPRLLTVRALELLQRADVVAHDMLISPSVLALVPAGTELLPVGRRCGEGKIDYRLHPDVLERARRGKTVVRLKCGDPLVFGRGGEEAEELTNSGIPFEIVPGISAALGAAAYAGIPLTHRQYASEVTFSTGHNAGEMSETDSSQTTVVLYMVSHRLRASLDRLVGKGYPTSTPAAYIAGATTAAQHVVVGTLANLAEKVCDMDSEAPALVIVGQVVGLRPNVAWFEQKRLFGTRILMARTRPGSSRIAERLREMGADVIESPTVSVERLTDYSKFDDAIRRRRLFDAVMFSCADDVEFTLGRMEALGEKSDFHAIAIGKWAEEALLKKGIAPLVTLPGCCREAFEKNEVVFAGKRLLCITSSQGRPHLQEELARLDATVEMAVVCRLSHSFRALRGNSNPIDLVVLASSSAARMVLTQERSLILKDIPMVAIGPLTEVAARECGARNVVRSPEDNIESLVSSVLEQLAFHATNRVAEVSVARQGE
jgi:uroporphyrinogen III methyltransferase / synthase